MFVFNDIRVGKNLFVSCVKHENIYTRFVSYEGFSREAIYKLLLLINEFIFLIRCLWKDHHKNCFTCLWTLYILLLDKKIKITELTAFHVKEIGFLKFKFLTYLKSTHRLRYVGHPLLLDNTNVYFLFSFFLQSLKSLVAFQAMVSIATIGLYIAYALPIILRVTLARKSFCPGPFNLGRFGVLVGWIAVLWVATITVLFSLPVEYPVTKDTLNYTPVAVGGVFILTVSGWILSARHWFKGPITNIGIWFW